MADHADRAQANIEREMAARLAAHRLIVGPSRADCELCGDPIPQARRKAMPGCRTCIDCQADIERAA
jgi:phage/conjugal plasmid C-4 type zinc finger TraR family protein